MVNSIVTICFTILPILTISLSYMITIFFHHIVRISHNSVTILPIFTILYNNIVITYGNNIVEMDNMVQKCGRNIVHHIFKFDSITDNIVAVCRPYCERFRPGLPT